MQDPLTLELLLLSDSYWKCTKLGIFIVIC